MSLFGCNSGVLLPFQLKRTGSCMENETSDRIGPLLLLLLHRVSLASVNVMH